MSATNAFTMTVSAVKVEAAPPVCWTGGGVTVRLAVALVLAVAVVVASVADDDDDDAVAVEDSLLDADEDDADEDDEAEDSEAELDAELELEPEPPGVIPPLLAPGSVLSLVFPAAALKASRVFGPDGGLITPTMPFWQWVSAEQ